MRAIVLISAWFAGLAAARLVGVNLLILWPAAAAAGLAAWRLRGRRAALWLACLAAALLAMVRAEVGQTPLGEGQVAFYNDRGPVTLTGVIDREPLRLDDRQQVRLAAGRLVLPGEAGRPVAGSVLVVLPRFPAVTYGERLVLRGRLETPPENPEFSYRAYLARQGIGSQMRRPRLVSREGGHGNRWLAGLLAVKERAGRTIERLIPQPEAGLLSGILLGRESGLSDALAADFRATGVTHIVVISGFNISIVAAIFLAAATPLLGKKGAAYAAVVGIAVYTVLVGADAAVVRAAIMGALYVISERLLGRRTYVFASLFAAGFLMTLANPQALWDVGFQLSFAATLSLMLYADPLARWAREQLGRRLARIWVGRVMGVMNEAVLVTLAAQVLTLPLLLFYFQQVSLVSLLANAFILPAQPGVMIWGGLATLVGLVSPALATPLAWVATVFLWYTIRIAHLFAGVPWALVPVPFSPAALLLVYAAAGGLTWYGWQEPERRVRLRLAARRHVRLQTALWGCLFALALGWRWEATRPHGFLRVVFFELAEGEGVLVQSPTGRQILIDGGRYPTELAQRLGEHLPFGDREIDLMVVTRVEAGRIGGLPDVFSRYRVGVLWLPADGSDDETFTALLAAAAGAGTPVRVMAAGEAAAIGDGTRLAVVKNDGETASLALRYGDFTLSSEQAGFWRAGGVVEVAGWAAGEAALNHLPRLEPAALGTIGVATDGRRMWWTAYR